MTGRWEAVQTKGKMITVVAFGVVTVAAMIVLAVTLDSTAVQAIWTFALIVINGIFVRTVLTAPLQPDPESEDQGGGV